MSFSNRAPTLDLFSDLSVGTPIHEEIETGAVILRQYAVAESDALMETLQYLVTTAPMRRMVTPGGWRMSVAMTNCGEAGWIADSSGYRYERFDPLTGYPWPPMPAEWRSLAERAAAEAGFPGFRPDACLINRYEPGAQLSLHQDKNEIDFTAPIVSVSLGLPALFLFGGLHRRDRPRRFRLDSGDVAVWGGPARLAFHGVARLTDGSHPLTGRCRINLTFRKALRACQHDK